MAIEASTLEEALAFLAALGIIQESTAGSSDGEPAHSHARGGAEPPAAEPSVPLTPAEVAAREKRRLNGLFVPSRAEVEHNGERLILPADERMVTYTGPLVHDGTELIVRLCAKCGRLQGVEPKKDRTIAADRIVTHCPKCAMGLTHDMPAEVREKHVFLCPEPCPGHTAEELQ